MSHYRTNFEDVRNYVGDLFVDTKVLFKKVFLSVYFYIPLLIGISVAVFCNIFFDQVLCTKIFVCTFSGFLAIGLMAKNE